MCLHRHVIVGRATHPPIGMDRMVDLDQMSGRIAEGKILAGVGVRLDCGRVGAPAVRLPDSRSLCRACWKRPDHRCVSCGQMKGAALVDETGAICHLC